MGEYVQCHMHIRVDIGQRRTLNGAAAGTGQRTGTWEQKELVQKQNCQIKNSKNITSGNMAPGNSTGGVYKAGQAVSATPHTAYAS